MLVDLLKQNADCRTEIGSVCRDIKALKEQVDLRGWSFVYREANKTAHILAHLKFADCNKLVWTDSVPSDIAATIAAEAELS
ncbi:hypothetical protein LINGRAHAP2_LOCUS1933 [Linum grandiflorum]